MNISLEGRNAVICGSTQGIGQAIAKELALSGANCYLLARNEKLMQEALRGLDNSKGQMHGYLLADFNEPAQVKNAIADLVANKNVHVLINNTGGPKPGWIAEEEEQKFIDTFSQHLVCNHILAKAVIPGMKNDGYGRIINIISTSVRIPISNLGVSNTIRAAVAAWAKSLSNEVAQFGITVNNVLPGYTNTNRLISVIETNAKNRKVEPSAMADEMKQKIPVRRFAEPAEIAAVVAFLASPAASFVNGTSLPVDGGSTGSI